MKVNNFEINKTSKHLFTKKEKKKGIIFNLSIRW